MHQLIDTALYRAALGFHGVGFACSCVSRGCPMDPVLSEVTKVDSSVAADTAKRNKIAAHTITSIRLRMHCRSIQTVSASPQCTLRCVVAPFSSPRRRNVASASASSVAASSSTLSAAEPAVATRCVGMQLSVASAAPCLPPPNAHREMVCCGLISCCRQQGTGLEQAFELDVAAPSIPKW